MRLWLLLLSASAICQAISQETPMEIFRSMAKSALRISSLSKVDPAFANWKSQFTDDQKRAAFLSSVRPLDTQNSQQWATYGLACEFLDQREDAISAYDRVLALRKTHSAVRLRLYKLTKNTDLLAPLKLSEYSLSGTLVSDAPPSDILRHLDTAKRKGREKANLNWVLPLVSQWQGEDYKKLCQAMLEIPALAEEGFSRLVALEPDRDHLDHARTARTANARAFRALRSEDYGLPSPRWQSAASVLLAHDETTNVDPALLKLYQADPDDFLTDATTYTNPRAAKRARQPIAHRIQEAVDAWRHRNLTTDLTPLFVEPLNSGIVPPSIEDYALHIPNVATWIVNLREGLEAHTFAPALHRLSQNEALFWDCLDHVYQNPGPNSKIQDAIAFGQHPLLHSSTYADLTSTLKHLKRSPFLAGIQEFRTYPRRDGEGSLFRDITRRIRQLPAARQRSYQVLLAGLPPTFGRDFLIAAIDEKHASQIASLIEQHRNEIEARSEEWKAALSWETSIKIPWLRSQSSPDEITQFLASKLSGNQLQTTACRLIRDHAQPNPNQAREVFAHAVALEKSPDFATDLVARTVAGPTSLEVAVLCLDFIAQSRSDLVVKRGSPLPYASALLSALAPDESDWEKALGPFFKQLSMATSHNESIPLLTGGLWKVMEALSGGDSERYSRMQSWFATDHVHKQHPALARWCHDLAALHQHLLSGSPTTDHTAWSTIRSALESDALSLMGRLALSESLAGLFDADLPPSILQSMSKMLLQGIEQELVTEAQLQTIAFILTKSDALARSDKANLAKQWVATLEGPTTDHGLGLSLFGLALQGQHATTIATIVEASDSQIDFEWLALARRQGNTKFVSDWILKDWARFDWLHGPQSGAESQFRQGDEVQIPELKDHPDHATFVEALFLALPDAKEKAEPARAERLHAFAKRITEFPWKDSALEQATLALVGVEPDAARHLTAHYQRIGARLQLSELHVLTNVHDRRCQQRLLQLAARFSLSDGPTTLRAHLEALLKLQDDSAQRPLQDLLLQNLENTFLSDWHLWTPEIFTANLELLPLAIDLDSEGWLALSWTMRLLAKDESNLVLPARIRRAKPASGADSSPKASFLRNVLTYLAQAMDKGALDKEARADVAIQISQSPNFMRTLAAIPELERGWFRYLEREALLTQEALLEHTGAFAKLAPRKGWAWAEAAQVHAAANKQVDALAHWNSALPFAGEDSLRYSTFQLGRLETLFKLGLHNDAGKAIKAFDQTRLHPDFRGRWEAAKKRLNVRPGAVAPVV